MSVFNLLFWSATSALLPVSRGHAHAPSEIVVAIRYLKAQGVSHAHLYLYRDDGKLLRQLTRDDSGQDRNPIFAPDGGAIIFTREKPKGPAEYWSVQPLGGGLRRLPAAPKWYRETIDSPYFTDSDPQRSVPPGVPGQGANAPAFKAPDGSVELVLREEPADDDDQIDGPGHGKHYLLRDLKSGRETEFGKLPGFEGVYSLLHRVDHDDECFLMEGPLRLAFFGLHLGSQDGDTCYALDLNRRRFVRLAFNWAAAIRLAGEPAFLTYTESRYVPISGSSKTANCSYMERWDASLHKVRFAAAGAALCYGASMYRPGRSPAVVSIRKSYG